MYLMANTKKIPTGIMVMGAPTYTNGPLVAGASSLPANTKQKEILKKIRTLPLRKYGSAKHKKLIKEYIKHDPYFPPSKTL